MADELIDICDEENNVVGRGMKSYVLENGLWHRTARVFVYNSKSEILMQLRAKDKELYPDRWDAGAAGHIAAGEHYIDAAIREAQEELGLRAGKDDLDLLATEKFRQMWGLLDERVFAYTYRIKFDGNIGDLKMQTEEVQKLEMVAAVDLEKDLKLFPEKYSPHPESYWSLLFAGAK